MKRPRIKQKYILECSVAPEVNLPINEKQVYFNTKEKNSLYKAAPEDRIYLEMDGKPIYYSKKEYDKMNSFYQGLPTK